MVAREISQSQGSRNLQMRAVAHLTWLTQLVLFQIHLRQRPRPTSQLPQSKPCTRSPAQIVRKELHATSTVQGIGVQASPLQDTSQGRTIQADWRCSSPVSTTSMATSLLARTLVLGLATRPATAGWCSTFTVELCRSIRYQGS